MELTPEDHSSYMLINPQFECLHLEITDEGICTTCSIDITSDEFIDSLPEALFTKSLGDLLGILTLTKATVELYHSYRADNRDPNNPSLFKLRQVGNQIVRIPDSILWAEIVQPAYVAAQRIGYLGSYERWDAICKEFSNLTIED
jgi:hypothetical protein